MSDVENSRVRVSESERVIPISDQSSAVLIQKGRDRSVSPRPDPSGRGLERQMDSEVEQVFREWDENIRCHKQASYNVRPMSTSSGAEKRRRRASSNRAATASENETSESTRARPSEINVKRHDDPMTTTTLMSPPPTTTLFHASTESLEEDARRHFYMESPVTGKRIYHMEFDVSGYSQENIAVKVSGSRLVVHAVQHETDTGRKSTTEFCRKVKLPADVDCHKLQCMFTAGRLVVEAPAPKKVHQLPTNNNNNLQLYSHTTSGSTPPTLIVTSSPSPKVEPLNTPVYRDTPSATAGRALSLTVELGKVFRADDVLVKVKSKNKLLVQAQREEKHDKSRMTASMTREFDLDEKIVPQSLKAGLTADGLLKVTAQVMAEVRVITNGLDDDSGDTPDVTSPTSPLVTQAAVVEEESSTKGSEEVDTSGKDSGGGP